VQLDGHGGDVDGNAAERKAYRGKEGSSSFLKKRTKKLLSVWFTRVFRRIRTSSSKSFLVLFFKKELLPSFASDKFSRQGRPALPAGRNFQ
jgi:hypothetical protein